jgi:hypothetical protein
LIFVGANVVATTFQVGASLASSFTLTHTIALIAAGSGGRRARGGAGAARSPPARAVDHRGRPALGMTGAALVAVVLYVTNFAWIALNNVIAASARRAPRPRGPAGRRLANGMGDCARLDRHDCRVARAARGGTGRSHRRAADVDGRRRAHRGVHARSGTAPAPAATTLAP